MVFGRFSPLGSFQRAMTRHALERLAERVDEPISELDLLLLETAERGGAYPPAALLDEYPSARVAPRRP